jgi:hypothetical protein
LGKIKIIRPYGISYSLLQVAPRLKSQTPMAKPLKKLKSESPKVKIRKKAGFILKIAVLSKSNT